MWTLVAEAGFGARARRDRPWVSVPALLPGSRHVHPGAGKRTPCGSCQVKRKGGQAGQRSWAHGEGALLGRASGLDGF